jgi:hypothetical protein
MATIISILNKLLYKVIDKNKTSHYLGIYKAYNSYIVRYWNFENQQLIRQQDKTLINALKKTEEALTILKEIGDIK